VSLSRPREATGGVVGKKGLGGIFDRRASEATIEGCVVMRGTREPVTDDGQGLRPLDQI